MRELGEEVIKAFIRGKSVDDVPVDEEPSRRFSPTIGLVSQNCPYQQVWDKEYYSTYLKRQKAKAVAIKPSRFSINIDVDVEESNPFEYPDIAEFRELGEEERVKTKEFQRDMARYLRDEEKTDVCISFYFLYIVYSFIYVT